MPSNYFINHEEGLVTITSNEAMKLFEAEDVGRTLLKDPSFDPYLPHLVDLRGLTLNRSKKESQSFREFVLNAYRPRVESSIAIVVDGSLDQHSLAGLYHISCSMEQTEVFDDYENALKWLMRREFADNKRLGLTAQ